MVSGPGAPVTVWEPGSAPRRLLAVGGGWFPAQPGGLERYYFELAAQLTAPPWLGDWSLRGLVVGPKAAFSESGGRVVAVPSALPLPARLAALRREAKQLSSPLPQLWTAHFALYALPLLDLLRRRPLVVHFHGPWARESLAEGGSPLAAAAKRQLERQVYRRADRLIALSAAFADLLATEYRVPSERIRVIPGGVDLERFRDLPSRQQARAELGWGERPTLFCLRRLSRRMGLPALLEAMAELKRWHPEVQLKLAGRGELAGELRQLIQRLGLENQVELLGRISEADLPLALRASDLTILPSRSLEGFGLVAAESLAAGTPVMATPVGGLPEVLAGLPDGLLLPGASSREIAGGLRRVFSGELELPSSRICQEHAVRFGWQRVIQRITAVYREVL